MVDLPKPLDLTLAFKAIALASELTATESVFFAPSLIPSTARPVNAIRVSIALHT
jgi:hypothetical protein